MVILQLFHGFMHFSSKHGRMTKSTAQFKPAFLYCHQICRFRFISVHQYMDMVELKCCALC